MSTEQPTTAAAKPTCPNVFGNDVHEFIPVAQCGSREEHGAHSWGGVYVGGGHCCGWPRPTTDQALAAVADGLVRDDQ